LCAAASVFVFAGPTIFAAAGHVSAPPSLPPREILARSYKTVANSSFHFAIAAKYTSVLKTASPYSVGGTAEPIHYYIHRTGIYQGGDVPRVRETIDVCRHGFCRLLQDYIAVGSRFAFTLPGKTRWRCSKDPSTPLGRNLPEYPYMFLEPSRVAILGSTSFHGTSVWLIYVRVRVSSNPAQNYSFRLWISKSNYRLLHYRWRNARWIRAQAEIRRFLTVWATYYYRAKMPQIKLPHCYSNSQRGSLAGVFPSRGQ
jgi:hypothetical protein